MNKKEYVEFQKYLAILYYEYRTMLNNFDITKDFQDEIKDILNAIEILRKVCIVEGE